nr:hypothetical protein CFP56_77197 [Quercus suber]
MGRGRYGLQQRDVFSWLCGECSSDDVMVVTGWFPNLFRGACGLPPPFHDRRQRPYGTSCPVDLTHNVSPTRRQQQQHYQNEHPKSQVFPADTLHTAIRPSTTCVLMAQPKKDGECAPGLHKSTTGKRYALTAFVYTSRTYL